LPHAPVQLAPGASTTVELDSDATTDEPSAFVPPSPAAPVRIAITALAAMRSAGALAGVIVCGGGAKALVG